MHRFIVRAALCEGALIDFPAEEAAHAFKVLRLRPGENVEVSDGEGALFAAELTDVSREIVRARLTERLDSKEPPVSLTLYMGYPKAEKLELIAQKLTELGAVRIVPVVMARSVARPDAKDGAKKRERLERIALEAAKQCGRGRVPEIAAPMSWKQATADMAERSLMLVPWEDARGTTLGSVREARPGETDIGLLIGSEGGISAEEIADAERAGAVPVTLGPRILRAETAAIASAAVVMALWGDV